MYRKTYRIRASAEFGLWTPPCAGPDRISLPVASHEGFRGVLRSIMGKREIDWIVHRVVLTTMPRWITLVRNEISNFGNGYQPICVDSPGRHTQRLSRILANPSYVLDASLVLGKEYQRVSPSEDVKAMGKFAHMTEKRFEQGGGYRHVSFGNKEFPAHCELTDEEPLPVDYSQDLGITYYGTDYDEQRAYFYPMRIDRGVVLYPSWDEVRQLGITRDDRRS